MKTTTSQISHSTSERSARFLIPLVFLCLGLLPTPKAFGVNPAPDGGYPGFNTAEGQSALKDLTTGVGNAAVGWHSLFSNTVGSYNTAVGAGTLLSNVGNQNTGEGFSNTAVGAAAMLLNTTGSENTAVGTDSLVYNDTGYQNTAVGHQALYSNTFGYYNNAVGLAALYSNTSGTNNNAFGNGALYNNIGNGNTAIGEGAGFSLTNGSGNVCIGQGVFGAPGESSTTRIKNIGSTPIVGGINVVVAGTGGFGDQKLGYASSSRRYKEAIKPMCEASETLFALKPVTFRAKGNMDTAHVKHYGLIAEDVAAVDPDLVVYNPDGKPETLRFDSINAMLLNEFLKEHRKVQELESTVANQEATIAKQQRSFQSRLGEQEKQIHALASSLQKVSAQLAAASPSLADLKLANSP